MRKFILVVLMLTSLIVCLCACAKTDTVFVSLEQGDGFSVDGATRKEVERGASVSFNVVLDDGWFYVGNNVGAVYDDGVLTLSAARAPQTIVLEVSRRTFSVTLEQQEGFSVVGERTVVVGYGDDAVFDLSFKAGWHYLSCNVEATFSDGKLKLSAVKQDLLLSLTLSRDSVVVSLAGEHFSSPQKEKTVSVGEDVVFDIVEDVDYAYLSNDAEAVYQNGKLTLKNVVESTVVNLLFERKTFEVSVAQGEHFSVNPQSKVVLSGDDVVFDVELDEGYVYISNNVGAKYANGKLTLSTVRADAVVTLKTEIASSTNKYTVSVSGEGVASASQQVYSGQSAIFQCEIDEDFAYVSNSANAEFADGELTVENVTSSMDVIIATKRVKFAVSVVDTDGLTVVANAFHVASGGVAVLRISIDDDYAYISNDAGATYADGVLTLTNVTKQTQINVKLARTYFYITVTAGNGFSIAENVKRVASGASATFAVSISEGFFYASNNVGATFADGVLTVANVSSDVTVSLKVYRNGSQVSYSEHGQAVKAVGEGNVSYVATADSGYVFVGWSVDKELSKGGEIFSYANNLTLSASDAPDGLTLVANFVSPSEKVIVTYHANGGKVQNSADTTLNYAFSHSVYLYPATFGEQFFKTFERDGYVPLEYNTRADRSGEAFSLGSRAFVDGNQIDLYVVWAKVTAAEDFAVNVVTVDGESTVQLKKYNGTDTEVVVPETIQGYPVTEILTDCFLNNSTLTRLVITKNINRVSYSAVNYAPRLKQVYLYDSVRYVYDDSFVDCSALSDLRVVAVKPPVYSGDDLGSIVRRFELLFATRNDEKPRMLFYGGCGMYHNIDGATMDQALENKFTVINCGQNANISGVFMLEVLSAFMRHKDVIVYAPENYFNIYTNRLHNVSWIVTESFYDAWRYVDIRDYQNVWTAFTYFQNGESGLAFTGRYTFYEAGNVKTYAAYSNKFDKYFTRNYVAEYKPNHYLAQYTVDFNELRDYISLFGDLYSRAFYNNGLTLYYATQAFYEDGLTNSSSELQYFNSYLKSALPCPMITNYTRYLYPETAIYDDIAHLTSEAAVVNSNKLAADVIAQLKIDSKW